MKLGFLFSSGRKRIFFLIIVPFIVYLPSLFFTYTGLDDVFLIEKRISLLTEPTNIPSLFTETYDNYAYYYRPIMFVVDSFNAMISGGSLIIFHLTNILFHILNVLLIYKLLQRLSLSNIVSFTLALFFALYPTVVPAVAWIPGRTYLLLTTFFLLSFLSFMNYGENRKISSFILFLLFLFIALLSQEGMFGLFLIFPLYYVLYYPKKTIRQIFLLTVGIFIVIFAYSLLRANAQVKVHTYSIGIYLSQFIENVRFLLPILGEVVIPLKLSFMKDIKDANYLLGSAVFMSLIVFFSVFRIKNTRIFILGLAFFLTSFLPVLVFLTLKTDQNKYLASYRYHLPLLGIILMISSSYFWEKLKSIRFQIWYVVVMALFFSLISILISLNYQDRRHLWKNEAQMSPNSFFTNFTYAIQLFREKDYKEAIVYLKKAESIRNNDKKLPYHFATAYYHLGEFDKSLKYFEKDSLINPADSKKSFQLGLIYYKFRNIEKAEHYWKETLKYSKNYPLANYNLGILSLKQDRKLEARTYFLRELMINPSHNASKKALDQL